MQPSFQVATLDIGPGQVVGPPVGLGRLRTAPEATQHVGPCGRQQVIGAELPLRHDAVDQGQPRLGPLGQGHGDGGFSATTADGVMAKRRS